MEDSENVCSVEYRIIFRHSVFSEHNMDNHVMHWSRVYLYAVGYSRDMQNCVFIGENKT